MALALTTVLIQKPNLPNYFPHPTNQLKPSFHPIKTTQRTLQSNNMITRRRASILLLLSTGKAMLINSKAANAAFDFRMTVPDQTLEEAENGIKGHIDRFLKVKELLVAESWKEAQKELRKSSSYLKQDIYTIIQAKPGSERPMLRKLYSNLFNSVTRLDYAARAKEATHVSECYDNVVVALNDILSRL